ncbi:hypothetical protein KVR01_007314 [Diaporthe batatas]|uniref:uncharacterized protein n=1 Tax=Diaporthe batatas TaxID=748121 RepID=UPI001D0562EA|nr:uncharacterized protein KVR01_007314 [Diaporthe batatas]KAG8162836.1 hypothetical protein KVR01_007314 [Diaporthe batatas]
MFVLSAELCRNPENFLCILGIPVRCCAVLCGAGAAPARATKIRQTTARRVSAINSANCYDATGAAPPFRFASSLHGDATQVAASSTRHWAISYDLAGPQSSAGGR